MKTVAITGPTGAIGIALIKKCIQNDVNVIAYVRPGSQRRDNIPADPHVSIADYDLNEFEKMARLSKVLTLPEVDVFYHLGWSGTTGEARNDALLQEQNIRYTLDVVRTAHAMKAKSFIGAGSQAEYGRVEGTLKPDTPTVPENGYGVAKLCAGHLSRLLCNSLDMKHVWVRILSVYGPYDGEGSMITSTVRQLVNGGRPSLTAGKQIWDYLYCDDAAEALFLLGDKTSKIVGGNQEINGKTYCLGSGKARPLSEYIRILRDSINPELGLGFGEIPYSDKQVMHLCADISELTKDTGFIPKVPFEKGITETIEYVRSHPAAGSKV